MAATKLQFNWSAVGFTPTGGSLTTLKKVTNVAIDPGGSLLGFAGDADRFHTVKINDFNDIKATVTSGDIATMQGFSPGATGAFTATHNDALVATGGAIVYALINAVVENNPSSGQHRQFGGGTITFQSYSSDGSTNPLSFTRT